MNTLSFDELKKRLLRWAAGDSEKILIFNEAISIMNSFRRFCLENRILDYSLVVDIYNNGLLKNQEYLNELKHKYKYFFVDNLEKSVVTGQRLILFLLKCVKETYLSYNSEEGINKFFGGNPELARDVFFPLSEVIELGESYTSSEAARSLASSIRDFFFEDKEIYENDFIKKR